MPSFNALNGVPSVANKYLMNDILRGEWGFEGPAAADLLLADPAGTAAGLEAGTDLFYADRAKIDLLTADSAGADDKAALVQEASIRVLRQAAAAAKAAGPAPLPLWLLIPVLLDLVLILLLVRLLAGSRNGRTIPRVQTAEAVTEESRTHGETAEKAGESFPSDTLRDARLQLPDRGGAMVVL